MTIAHLSNPVRGIARRLRMLRYWREHQALGRLELMRRFGAESPGGDPFEHLGDRDYLVRGLSTRERVQFVLSHYRFEDARFNAAYKEAVYGGAGLALWQHDTEEHSFVLRLEMAPRHDAEGDLTISLLADGHYLHRLSYTWVDGELAGVELPTVPFITRNQGRWADSGPAFEAFDAVFPNNSPSFFCFAAMQGVAQALGMDRVVAIRCTAHIHYDPADLRHFENAYDGFWRILGGAEMNERSFLIRLPFYLKPLEDMPSKHRKRAAQRRENWRAIGDSTRSTLLRHMVAVEATAPAGAAAEGLKQA
ncbi:hypothetical protein B0920_01525 [Massilia sp. KIM]|uniref:DUF535 family protein n=1 Tax=Massilia sp. KIM TaxID=1955422 RepID=UPI00098EC3BE|nr:DUF535 family protein [Massilia sp. KIM]OON62195.1 hypothetical protein B0920_01525 [Massilia sp. KIM]